MRKHVNCPMLWSDRICTSDLYQIPGQGVLVLVGCVNPGPEIGVGLSAQVERLGALILQRPTLGKGGGALFLERGHGLVQVLEVAAGQGWLLGGDLAALPAGAALRVAALHLLGEGLHLWKECWSLKTYTDFNKPTGVFIFIFRSKNWILYYFIRGCFVLFRFLYIFWGFF